MGCYSYICKECNKSINENEGVHLFHIRHGKVLGEAVGRYNGYGGVKENTGYDNKYFDKNETDSANANCHDEIIRSYFKLEDSCYINEERKHMKAYKKDIVTKNKYQLMRINELVKEGKHEEAFLQPDKIFEEFNQLPPAPSIVAKSGVVAYHQYCYNHSIKRDMSPSTLDPNQGCGKPRKKYAYSPEK